MYTQEDCKKLKQAISEVKLLEGEANEIGCYKNAVLVCLDAVLSINRKYYSFVVPRIKRFQEEYSDIDTLPKLWELIKNTSTEEFVKIWNYNHPQRVEILTRLVGKLIDCAKIKNSDSPEQGLSKLRMWANSTNIYGYKDFNVPGIGVATYQYIRMMLGAKTVKPDVHIKRDIFSVLNKKLNDYDTIDIFEKACNSQNIDISKADRSLWKKYAGNVDEQFVWETDKWTVKNKTNL